MRNAGADGAGRCRDPTETAFAIVLRTTLTRVAVCFAKGWAAAIGVPGHVPRGRDGGFRGNSGCLTRRSKSPTGSSDRPRRHVPKGEAHDGMWFGPVGEPVRRVWSQEL